MLGLAHGKHRSWGRAPGCMNDVYSYGAEPACGPLDQMRAAWPPIAWLVIGWPITT